MRFPVLGTRVPIKSTLLLSSCGKSLHFDQPEPKYVQMKTVSCGFAALLIAQTQLLTGSNLKGLIVEGHTIHHGGRAW